jgi:hypothetical protein
VECRKKRLQVKCEQGLYRFERQMVGQSKVGKLNFNYMAWRGSKHIVVIRACRKNRDPPAIMPGQLDDGLMNDIAHSGYVACTQILQRIASTIC